MNPDHLPLLICEKHGDALCISFMCPPCRGHGRIEESRTEHVGGNYITTSKAVACAHCFGFGRLPVPTWYREQVANGER